MLTEPLQLARLRSANLEFADVPFTDGVHVYRTSGQRVGHGGMGNVWTVTQRPLSRPDLPTQVVTAKTFREEFLFLLREDELARRRFDHFERVLDQLRPIDHPNVLPVLLVAPIADNYLLIAPLAGQSLLSLLSAQPLSPRERVRLFISALRGLSALHERGIVHRDFTLNNILTLPAATTEMPESCVVFDFDLSVVPDLLDPEERTYNAYYQGRILGSPEFSIAPELVDEVLGQETISPRVDVYAAGTALFALFSDSSIYGEAADLSALFYRISEGLVRSGESRIVYPDSVPRPLRPIIQACLEREPSARFTNATALLRAVEHAAEELTLNEKRSVFRRTLDYVYTRITLTPEEKFKKSLDPSVSAADLARMETTLARHGYIVEKALGRVKGHPIYLTMPDPELVANGRFPEENTYRKIVTAIDVGAQPAGFVETWLGRVHPILASVRQGYLTALYKVVHERQSGELLLFSEYVADARFGTDLANQDLTLEEVFGLGLIVALTISRLHEHGLAHNNVRPESLVFKGNRSAGRVQSLFVGLVEPSFAPEALAEDVRRLAGMIVALIRQSRVDALRPTMRPMIERLRDRLRRLAAGESRIPTIKAFIDVLADGLGAIESNFDLIRAHGGSVSAYADLLVRHSLYSRLYAVDVAAVG
jgi:serine/threonine-protein kinase